MSKRPSTIRDLVDRQADARPDAVYAVAADGRGAIDYSTLRASCRQLSAGFAAWGIRAGDTVSLVMPNGLQTIRVLLGAMCGGICVNPVNLLSQAEQIRYVLDHSDCRLVVAAPEWAERVGTVLTGIGREIRLVVIAADGDERDLGAAFPEASATSEPAPPTPDALALLMYTSGTTGVPKGVMLSQSNLVANALAIADEHALSAADRVLAVLPLYHINAFAVTMLAPLAHGGSVAVLPKFSATTFWRDAIECRCTWLNVVPTIVSYLLEGAAPAREQLAAIRFCRSASAALPAEHHRAFEARFGIGIIETMGLTETAAPAFSNPLRAEERKLGSVGRASGGEARVVDEQLAPVPDGTTGELVIRGPHVMLGYYKNDEATRASRTPDGWLRTGDLGHRDRDGFFFVTGRKKELIIKGGENIAPREIDEVLLRHPAVLEAAALGVPDRHYGQEIAACVVMREGVACDLDELRAFCVEHLGRYKAPSQIRSVAALPRGPSGKVQRLKLLGVFDPPN